MSSVGYPVTSLTASQVRASGDQPVIEVRVDVGSGASGVATVPTGGAKAIMAITGEVAGRIVGVTWTSLHELDAAIGDVGRSATDSGLAGAVTLGVSMAAARALATADRQPLYRWLPGAAASRLPVPYVKLMIGGRLAGNRLDFRELMVVPLGASTFAQALGVGKIVHHRLGETLGRIGFSAGAADDGSFAPAIQAPEDALDLLCEAVAGAGLRAGTEGVGIALDVDASQLREADGTYRVNGTSFDAVDMVEYLAYLVDRYPVCSIEDGMAQGDAKGWRLLAERLGGRVRLVGDDAVVTTHTVATGPVPGVRDDAGGRGMTARIELSRAGTVSAVLDAAGRCSRVGAGVMVSHRVGGSADAGVADLAVAAGCDQLVAGTPASGGGAATYERLAEIEAEAHDLPYGGVRP
jgi:enolase